MKVSEDLGEICHPFPAQNCWDPSPSSSSWLCLEAAARLNTSGVFWKLELLFPSPRAAGIQGWGTKPGGTGHPQPGTLSTCRHTPPSQPQSQMGSFQPVCANCARVPVPGGNPSSGPWFVPPPHAVHADAVGFSRSGSQGSDAAHLGPAAPTRNGWSWQGTSRDGGTVIMWPGAAWLSLSQLGSRGMRIWGIWGV